MDAGEQALTEQATLLARVLAEAIEEIEGPRALELVDRLQRTALAVRAGAARRAELSALVGSLADAEMALAAAAFTDYFNLLNAAEEQHRIRVLRRRDRPDAAPDGSLAAACAELRQAGASADDVRSLLSNLLVMPVLTAHPTESRRRTVIAHLADISGALDRLDDPRPGARERARTLEALREAVVALACTARTRATRPTALDEVRAGLLVFERTLLDVTPAVYRELEDGLASGWPGQPFTVGPFLRWGTWIGGDRDGNPFVTAEVTRSALERQRDAVLRRYVHDVDLLARALSISPALLDAGGDPGRSRAALAELEASLEEDRARLPRAAHGAQRLHAREPWREKLRFMRARLEAALGRGEGGYPDAPGYVADLELLERTLAAAGLARVARGRVRDARRRAEVFGFHLATLDLRQHSRVHEAAVAELLERGGSPGYAALDDGARTALLARLLATAELPAPPRDRRQLSPATGEVLATLEVVGRARRDMGPQACERYIVSFTSSVSDLLEVLFLARAARLAPDELRPVPLLEQLEDLDAAGPLAGRMLDLAPVRAALGGELEVMIGYSDSGKQVGYVASNVALYRAQLALAEVAEARGATLTIFHGRGGAVGRGGGPAHRAIRAQPARALRGRFRVTEQGETIATRYGRRDIAVRDLEQMVSAVLVTSVSERRAPPEEERRRRDGTLERAARAAREAYARLVGDQERLTAYALSATPMQEMPELRIASRPASRSARLSFEDLRAIPWVFSWNQSRHGVPGWYGLGAALEAVVAAEGLERARELYREWPFFRGLVDNARLALVRADMDVAAEYAGLAEPPARTVYEAIRGEFERTARLALEVAAERALLARWPAIARTVERRNPYVDVLSHLQVELLRRLRAAPGDADRERVRNILFVTINGIAAGLQTVG